MRLRLRLNYGRSAIFAPIFVAVLLAMGVVSMLAPGVASAQTGEVNVSIQNYSYLPNSITVVIGLNNTVTWTNNDYVVHTVTSNDNSFKSLNLASGSTFTYTFTTAGTFGYHCSIHTYMMGTVTVKNGSSTSTSSQSSSSSTTSVTSSSSSSTKGTANQTTAVTSTTTYGTTNSLGATGLATTTSQGSTTSNTGGSAMGVPEFPVQAAAVLTFTVVILVSYGLIRHGRLPGRSMLHRWWREPASGADGQSRKRG